MVRSLIAVALMTIVTLSLQPYALADKPQVEMQTSMGAIVIALNPEAAPKTVENFLTYVRNGFYDDTIFHRVIKAFMIQGGGLTRNMQKKKTLPPIPNEADNGLQNNVGTIAMARTGDPHSATAQFFINVADNKFLNHKGKNQSGWGYCVFGQVIQGMAVVKKIESVQTGIQAGRRDVPLKPVIIHKAFIRPPQKQKKEIQP